MAKVPKLQKFKEAIQDLLGIKSFKNEQDVREDFILPLLQALGYSNKGNHKIERGIYLQVPDLIIGTKKKSLEHYSPDYVLNVNGKRRWLIDAKGPKESVLDPEHISQAYSYSIHREINLKWFVLCNGAEFAVFKTKDQSYTPSTVFKRKEFLSHYKEIYEIFSVDGWLVREATKKEIPQISLVVHKRPSFKKREKPIEKSIVPRKQASNIHARVHPYFTKRAWNMVREYVEHFTEPGETVLDPFGGAGVTAIEAVLTGRKAIHIDLNPIANFMTEALILPVSIKEFGEAFHKIVSKFEPAVKRIYSQKFPKPEFWYPQNIKLPRDADVEFVHEYFSPHQLASMALLKHLIMKIGNKSLRKVFLLIFSSTLVKCNLSFHNTGRDPKEGGGDAGFLKYYRYQIPRKRYPEQNPAQVFKEKFGAMMRAKRDVALHFRENQNLNEVLKIIEGSAADLKDLDKESVDFVFTDPPYGSKISYLDTSILWNAWLHLSVPDTYFTEEVIAGGSLQKTDEDYIKLLQKSLQEIYRVLKPNRWFSIVFASENPRFWHAIRDYSLSLGFDHINTICQPSDRKTVKKNQNPLTVFKGELILNFRKGKKKKKVIGVTTAISPRQFILNSAELTMVVNGGRATIEKIMNDLIPKLWESGLLQAVSNEEEDIRELLKEAFDFDKEEGIWQIRVKANIGSHIPVESRIKFYLLSCLNRAKLENRKLTIDDIVMEVIPYLRNGITPSNQDIITELRKVANSTDNEHWTLDPSPQMEFHF